MRNHTDLARRLLDVVGRRVSLTALCFGAPTGLRLLSEPPRSRR